MSERYDPGGGDEQVSLSATGARRRDEILRAAVRAGQSRRRRRLAGRAAGAAGGVIAIAWAVAAVLRPAGLVKPPLVRGPIPPAPPPVAHVVVSGPRPAVKRPAVIIVQRIETDPTLVDRLAVPRQGHPWRSLSDDELLTQLAQAGRPAGLAYVDGRAQLLWRDRVGAEPRGLIAPPPPQ